MNTSNYSTREIVIKHVRITCNRFFAEVKKVLEASLPQDLHQKASALLIAGDEVGVKNFEAENSKLLIFLARDHGSMLEIVGKKKNAIQYEIGNPITASKMTRHKIGAALYAPLRIALYETDEGEVVFEYDLPSSFFDQFNN